MHDFHGTFRDLLHVANLRHGTDGFTSLPKEGVLRIFSPLKIRRLRPGLNPRTWVPKASTLPIDIYTMIKNGTKKTRWGSTIMNILYTSTKRKLYSFGIGLAINYFYWTTLKMEAASSSQTCVTSYRGADKSLARPWKETSYGDQDLTTLRQDLWRTNSRNILLLFVRHKSWYSVVSLGRGSLFSSRIGLRTYQQPGIIVKYKMYGI